jgi:hypothetical protein
VVFNGSFSGENAFVENGKTRLKVMLPKGEQAGMTVTFRITGAKNKAK